MTVKEQTIFNSRGNIIKTTDKEIHIIGRMDEPLILIFENVLSHEECDVGSHPVDEKAESSIYLIGYCDNPDGTREN
ncbi:hypothetical protein [Paenibacillus albus]|uniref:Uncharacterized protein n=1 Tax=Paenibacillus albus TaxID=2495582 RepID=A0A3S9A009_9BACL|nr:hypothetical protein [Paenibacillus albus]AZN38974.1 hypothetical protein EJC50_04310 [Paenibacillus albus]